MTNAWQAAFTGLCASAVFAMVIDYVSANLAVPRPRAARTLLVFALGVGVAALIGSIGLAVLVAALAAATITDLESGLIFDAITIPTLVFLTAMAGPGSAGDTLIAAAACAGVVFVLFAISRGRGIGLGDLKLAACIGAGAGLIPGLAALGLAFILGAAHGIALLATAKIKRGEAMRFAPYLAAGTALSAAWAGKLWP